MSAAVKLTAVQMRDLATIARESGRGGVPARTGRTLCALGLVSYTPGYRPHLASSGWRLTAKGRAILAEAQS